MNGKAARHLRKTAQASTIGEPMAATKKAYKKLKAFYYSLRK